jgi:transcriptional regulator with XRE-family HTH domain
MMNGINIAKTIIKKRKEKGITQDGLANFIGVSSSSVSKWETGQSYPDIIFLPQLASYFNITLDELMGYEAQLTEGEINKLYKELAHEFATKPFNEVMARCRETVKKYFSCFSLLYRMGVLYVNYSEKAETQKNAVIEEARGLFIRVKEDSNNLELKQLALNMEAYCAYLLGRPDEIIELLANIKPPPPHEGLLAQAYTMTGKTEAAKTIFQKMIYYNVHVLVRVLPAYLILCAGDGARFEEIYKRTSALIGLFNLKKIDPMGTLPFYMAAAQAYMAVGDAAKTLAQLEGYADVTASLTFPLEFFRGDEFFNYLKNAEEDFSFGQTEMPQDEKTTRQSIAEAVTANPAFAALSGLPQFKEICKKLKA